MLLKTTVPMKTLRYLLPLFYHILADYFEIKVCNLSIS